MKLITVGMNHRTAPVEERELFLVPDRELPLALKNLTQVPSLREGAILSTCNRVEVYGLVCDHGKGEEQLRSFLCQKVPERLNGMNEKLYTFLDEESVRHLFRVTSGIDSMVLGETEILGQVKSAYREAVRARSIGKILHSLFQKSFQTAKMVRERTGIGKGKVSVSSVAVNLARRILGNLSGKQIMILGAGQMSQLTGRALREQGVTSVFVSNRNYERARELAQEFAGQAIRFEEYLDWMQKVDIVISSTAAPHFLLTKDQVAHLMKKRKQRPLFLLDIAVPRDIDPSINELDNVYLYDIDDMEGIVRENLSYRENQLALCHSLIQQKSERFMSWFHQLKSSE